MSSLKMMTFDGNGTHKKVREELVKGETVSELKHRKKGGLDVGLYGSYMIGKPGR
jgi:hypothetical protein